MIFVDTSFWIALRNQRDQHHREARSLLKAKGNEGLATSNQVRGETWTYLRRRVGHGGAVAFLDSLARSRRIQVLTVGEKLESEALLWLRQHDEREYSFVDATSFVLMRSHRIQQVLAFGGDFSAAGFVELRPR